MRFKSFISMAASALVLLTSALATPRICGAQPSASSVESHADPDDSCPENSPCTKYSVPSGKSPDCFTGICHSGACSAKQKENGTHLRTRALDYCKEEAIVCKDGVETPSDRTATHSGLSCNFAPDDGNVCTNPGCLNGSCTPDLSALRPADDTVTCRDSLVTDCQTTDYKCRGGACTEQRPINKSDQTHCDDITDDAESCVAGRKCDGICTVRGCNGSGQCVQDAHFFWPQTNNQPCGQTQTTDCKVRAYACENGLCKENSTNINQGGSCTTLSNGEAAQTGACFRDPTCDAGECKQDANPIICPPSSHKCKENQCDKNSPTGCTEVDKPSPCCGNGIVEGPDAGGTEECDSGDDTPTCRGCMRVVTTDCTLDCDDLNPCSDDFCDLGINPETGESVQQCFHEPNYLSCCDGLNVIPGLQCPPSRINDDTSGPIRGGNGSVSGGGISGGGITTDPGSGGGITTGGGTDNPGVEDPADTYCRESSRCPLTSTACPDPNAKTCPACDPPDSPTNTPCYNPTLYDGSEVGAHKITGGGPVVPKAKRDNTGTVIIEGDGPTCGCACKYAGTPDIPCGGGGGGKDPCENFIPSPARCQINPWPWTCYVSKNCPPDKPPMPYCCRELVN